MCDPYSQREDTAEKTNNVSQFFFLVLSPEMLRSGTKCFVEPGCKFLPAIVNRSKAAVSARND